MGHAAALPRTANSTTSPNRRASSLTTVTSRNAPFLPLVLGTSALVLLAASPAASAAAFQCDASALRVDRRHRPRARPITANRGAASCAPQDAGGALPATPLPVAGGALYARTTFTGAEPLSQVASASAGIGELTVALPLPALPASTCRRCRAAACSPSRASAPSTSAPALAALIAPAGPLLRSRA